MSKFDGIKVGDRVRVVVEGEVTYKSGSGNNIEINDVDLYDDDEVVSVEKVKPPVEQFQPGDVIRDKRFEHVYALGNEGFLCLSSEGEYRAYGQDNLYLRLDQFTSEDYERVGQ